MPSLAPRRLVTPGIRRARLLSAIAATIGGVLAAPAMATIVFAADPVTHPPIDEPSDRPDPCACPADADGNGQVDQSDIVMVLAAWGPCNDCPADVDGDGIVGFPDLMQVLQDYGPCP